MYNVTLWQLGVIIFQWKQEYTLCVCVVIELHVTVDYIQILSVAQRF